MKSLKVTLGILAIALCGISTSASAQVSVSGGVDLVSTYVWRGSMLGGASIQPYAEVAAGNFAVGAWGSTSIEETSGLAEYDFYVSYSVGNFSAMITDYWCGGKVGDVYSFDTPVYELTLAYTISESFPLSLSVNTNFAGADTKYSTYIALDYPLTAGDVAIDLSAGITPAAGAYADGFAVCNLSATASKPIAITDSFELPISVTGVVNPAAETLYLLCGTSFSF